MAHTNRNTPKILAKKIDGQQRIGTLPKRFPNIHLLYEDLIFQHMDSFTESYIGGYWAFMELDNGGFYMALSSDEMFEVIIASNCFRQILSSDALSIVVNLYALSYLSNRLDGLKYLSEQYYLLRDFACEHDEATNILRAID